MYPIKLVKHYHITLKNEVQYWTAQLFVIIFLFLVGFYSVFGWYGYKNYKSSIESTSLSFFEWIVLGIILQSNVSKTFIFNSRIFSPIPLIALFINDSFKMYPLVFFFILFDKYWILFLNKYLSSILNSFCCITRVKKL